MISMTLYRLSGIVSSHSAQPQGARTLTGSAIVSLIAPSRNGSLLDDHAHLGNNANLLIGHDIQAGG